MATSTPQPAKVPIPSPLPTRRGRITIPASLRHRIFTAMGSSPGAFERTHQSLDATLRQAGFTAALENNAKSKVEEDYAKSRTGQVNELEIVERLRAEVRTAVEAGGVGLSEDVIRTLVDAVKAELELCCVCVDGAEWVEEG